MRLTFNQGTHRFEAQGSFEERDIPRAAGFRWDKDGRTWFTVSAQVAGRLCQYADEGTAAAFDKLEARAVEESRAVSADVELPIAAGKAFLPYQKAGIVFALARPNVLIGDEMGLGKTAQAIGVVNADESLKRILVICPASLSRNWVREFGMFGSRPLSIGIADMKTVPSTDIVVATYDAFSRKTATMEALRATEWDAMVLDEAHYLKNRDANRTRQILGGRDPGRDRKRVEGLRARRRLYLTGTPVTSRPIELWTLVHSLAPDTFHSFRSFVNSYCGLKEHGYGWDYSGASNLDQLQKLLRSSIMIRRLKSEVLTELPAKRRQLLELPVVTNEARRAVAAEREAEVRNEKVVADLRARKARLTKGTPSYLEAVAELKATRQVAFTEMSKVRHLTALAKLPQVLAHVRDAVEAGSKTIVFAHHRDVIDQLEAGLADLGVVTVTGDTPVAGRQENVDAFQTNSAVRVFIGNIQAAGVGLTLTASSHVVFAELDWVPGNVSQAEDRAHRLGQRSSVLVQHLVLEGSLDARMAQTLVSKQQVIDQALDTAAPGAGRNQVIATASAGLADGEEDDQDMADAEADVIASEAVRESQEVAISEDVEGTSTVEVPSPVPERPRRGRPPKAGGPLSQKERTRAYKASRQTVGVDVPGILAERMRALRDARGLTTEQLLTAAFDALEKASQLRP